VRLPFPPLLLVTDRSQASVPLQTLLVDAFAGGIRWASLREKDLPMAEQIDMALALRPLARIHGAVLTLHGDAEAARAAGLDGVHLAAGADAADARSILGRAALIGISVHDLHDVRRLDPATVDYAAAGPTYETASKPGYGPALGLSGIAAMAGATSVPIIAIGGLTPSVVADTVAAGANGIAIMGGLMRAANQTAVAAAYVSALVDAHERTRRSGESGSGRN
jgi:thiamine-phosphate pyrophosphorylase